MAEHLNSDGAERPRRSYRMAQRQAAVERTRERIVEAAFDLHATIGPSRTTVSAIADRAGVQRHTVYAHFPDTEALFEACTDHGMRTTGMPDPEGWREIDDAVDRCRHGLGALHAWYRANERMLANVLAEVDPGAPPSAHPDPFERRMTEIFEVLREPWTVGKGQGQVLAAVVGHAIAFTTWRSLAAGGLADARIGSMLTGLVDGVASGSLSDPSRKAHAVGQRRNDRRTTR